MLFSFQNGTNLICIPQISEKKVSSSHYLSTKRCDSIHSRLWKNKRNVTTFLTR